MMRLRELAPYCWASKEFFDAPDRVADGDSRYPDPVELDGTAWRRDDTGVWTRLQPIGMRPPEQGWKIHVASTLDDAVKVLDVVWRYCTERRITFKFVRSARLLQLTNEKSFSRTGSGKFITIYPRDDREFTAALDDLREALAAFQGPYVLSDLRHRDGPLYVRYGAFRRLWCTGEDGELVPAVRRPDGELVPDTRSPGFAVPEWISVPAILEPDVAARRRQITEEFPYRIERALHFSNSGGVYQATDERTGECVVVREARPHAGLDRSGRDAVHRMQRERELRARLAGLDCLPRFIDYRVVAGHHYLIEEYVDGRTLLELVISRLPLAGWISDEERRSYTAWAHRVTDGVEAALSAVHGRGVSYGDLHPRNILVRPDDTVVLVDFEFAAELADNRAQLAAAPGFAAPPGVGGAEADRFSMARVRLMTLLPLLGLAERDPAKPATMIEVAGAEFAGDRHAAHVLRRATTGDAGPADHARSMFTGDLSRLAAVRTALVGAIGAAATPDRTDRLFPGDPAQFGTGGVDVETGAAGVLHALHTAGAGVPSGYVDWLAARALHTEPARAGLFAGLHGVAVVLADLDRADDARMVLERVRETSRRCGRAGLRDGLAGACLALAHLAGRTGDTSLLDDAVALAERLAALVAGDRPAGELRPPDKAGLMNGLTGVAALFLRLFELLGEARYLRLAENCLRHDLGYCVARPAGTCYILDGARRLPYLDIGSLGLAVVLAWYLRYREDPEFAAAVTATRRACDVPFAYQAGLCQGRAGIILGLAALGHPDDGAAIRRHVQRLGWHALRYRDGIAFPGRHNLRLSMDYSTGTAGVLLAVHTVLTGNTGFLPALDLPPGGGQVTGTE